MGRLKRDKPNSFEEWLLCRHKRGIGGSEAAAIVGVSKWMTANELWQIKTGQKERKDISDNPLVAQGHRMESGIRELYISYHPEYKVKYHPYELLYQSDRPWLFATLDGEIYTEDKRKGVLEIKTSTPQSKADWDNWNCQIPDQYMVQLLHQMLASGFDFADLVALLINKDRDFVIRTYHFERADYEEDLNWLLKKEEEFWKSIQNRTLPPMTLVI